MRNFSKIDKSIMKVSKFLETFNIKNSGRPYPASKISDENLYSYNVYQIEGEGRNKFSKIEVDENTIMGLPIKKIKEYLESYG